MEKMIQHFSHHHPLFLFEDRSGIACDGCHEPIFGSGYRCIKCPWFDLHKSCAELPSELQHPLHRKHPLILLPQPPYDFKCRACEKTCSGRCPTSFVYRCSFCKFDLDIKCASPPVPPLTIEAVSHDHPLTLFPKWISFTCDACGKKDEGMPHLCVICGIWYHSICASSPRTVKNIRHKHPLKLTHSLQHDQSDHQFCDICVEKVNLEYWVYHCSSCDFVAHLHCATDQKLRGENSVLETKDKGPVDESISQPKYEDEEIDESVDSIASIVKKINSEGEPIEIKHFSHEHDLTLIESFDNNQKCDGCIRPIVSPFYSCAQCSFFLHKSCAELSRKKRHPLHKHLLTLLPKVPINNCTFRCDACDCRYNGFTYRCDECDFDLDVQCSLISDKLTHDGHEHPLFLSHTTNNLNCSACGDSGENMFRCAKCEFTLNFNCATLPCRIWYRQHQHPFTLQFTAEDDSGQYYCDICEESRDPKHWFYYCAKCSYPAHSKCILGKYSYIKFEKTYKFDGHLHPLTLVKEIKGKVPCDKCGNNCRELDFECKECDYNIHGLCVRK